MNEIFYQLIKNKISQFESDFINLSRQIFVNEEGKLIHSGEFGVYREKIVSEFLKPFLPSRLSIGSGFIITDKNNNSTQCDIIIYDNENTPIIENGTQRFFPVETVVGVIEVKSILKKNELKKALIKLSKIKSLKHDIKSKPYTFKDSSKEDTFNPKCIYDQIATFIIYEDFSFDIKENYEKFFTKTYKDIDSSLFHNMILCLKKCCCLYKSNENKPIYCAYFKYSNNSTFQNMLLYPAESEPKEHIILFLNYFHMLISSISSLYIDMTQYLRK